MSTYAQRVALAAVSADLSAVRWASAIRRAFVVVAALVVGYYLVSPGVGINAATAALLVGLVDKGQSPRSTWHTMGSTTILLCAVTLFAGLLSWSALAIVALMLGLAFCSGVSAGIDLRAPQIFVYGAVLAAAHLINPLNSSDTIYATALIALAGGLQTLLAWLSTPFIADQPERRLIAKALTSTAAHAAQIGLGATELANGSRTAAADMAAAEDQLSKSDLTSQRRQQFTLLLADADLLRIEARGFFAREALGVRTPSDVRTREAFADAAEVLLVAADAVLKRHSEQTVQHLDDLVGALEQYSAQTPLTPTAKGVISATLPIPEHVHSITDNSEYRRVHRPVPDPLRVRLLNATRRGSTSLNHGIRMASATFVGLLVADLFHLTHGTWVAVTAMMLLRPDVGPTAPRILMRALGTVASVAAVVAITFFVGWSPQLMMCAVAIVVTCTYALVSVNYSTMVALLSTSVILLIALSGLDPIELSLARLLDVVVGCVIGTAFAFAFPIWRRTSLASDAAKYADAMVVWLRLVAQSSTVEPDQRPAMYEAMRAAGRKTRNAQQTASATMSVALLEPPDPSLNAGVLGVVLSWIRRVGDAGIAAETILRHGAADAPTAAEYGFAAADDLAATADTLRRDANDEPIAVPDQSPLLGATATPDRLTEVMVRASRSANAALRSAQRVREMR